MMSKSSLRLSGSESASMLYTNITMATAYVLYSLSLISIIAISKANLAMERPADAQ